MSKYVLGTNKYVFDSTFWGIDPQYIQGINLWRQYPGIPEPRNVTSFGAILPIVATQNVAAQSVNISFSIIDLPETSTYTGKALASKLVTQPGLTAFAPAGMTIKTVPPVQQIRSNEAVVLYFSINSLPRVEIGKQGNMYSSYGTLNPRKNRISVKSYNVSNGVNIISEPPMVDEIAGSTATFSFDITELPRI